MELLQKWPAMFLSISSIETGNFAQAFEATRCIKWQLHFMHTIFSKDFFKWLKTELYAPAIAFVVSEENPTKLSKRTELAVNQFIRALLRSTAFPESISKRSKK